MTFKKLLNDPELLAKEITALVGEDFEGAVGFRGLYKTDNHEALEPSYVWDDGNYTDEQLRGTSAIMVSADWYYDSTENIVHYLKKYAELALQYGDGQIGLVVGEYENSGEDMGEILIKNARVINIWDK